MKSHFLKTALTLAAFSSLVSPIFTHSSQAMAPEDLITQLVFPTTKCTKIMKRDTYRQLREGNDWETLNSCRLVSTGLKKATDKFIVENKLFTFHLNPDNYKDERLERLAPLVTTLSFKNWQGDNLKEIGSALAANTFPSLQKLEYFGNDDNPFIYSSNCHSLGELGSESLADALNQLSQLSPCPWPQLQEIRIFSFCHPHLWESLDKLPNLQKLELSCEGDLYKFAKKLPSFNNLTSLTWHGWLDRLGVRKFYKELKKGKLEKLDYLKISSSTQLNELEYAKEKFNKLHDKRPNIKFGFTR